MVRLHSCMTPSCDSNFLTPRCCPHTPAYIYKEVSPGNWVLHTDLQAPAQGIFFGRAVAIEDDLAVVGAYGWGEPACMLACLGTF